VPTKKHAKRIGDSKLDVYIGVSEHKSGFESAIPFASFSIGTCYSTNSIM